MMVNSRFAVAIHILSLIAVTKDRTVLTSDFIAGSVNTNPVVVRRISSQLKKAHLLSSTAGVSGYVLTKTPQEISLLEVYKAVQAPDELFALHKSPNPACSVGKQIIGVLTNVFDTVQQAMERELQQQSLQHILDRIE